MIISIISLFPKVFKPLLESSILAKAQKKGKLKVCLVNLRDFGIGPHKQVDDRPYGGGVGMILRVDILAKAIRKVTKRTKTTKVILLTPQGKIFNQKTARRLAKEQHLILICGHYEGFDERARKFVDEEISIGDYILSGGEVATMVILDSVTRLLPGVLKKEATQKESFSTYTLPPKADQPLAENAKRYISERKRGKKILSERQVLTLLEPPQYTRPEEFEGTLVPKVLLSGNHKEIEKWRLKEALKKTKKGRPALLMTN